MGLLETFLKDCAKELEKATRSLFCKLVRHFLVKMSPQESDACVTFSSTVWPYLQFLSTDGTAVLETWTAFCL